MPLTQIKNRKGQGLIEYLMLVSLIAVATIGVVRIVGYNLGRKYENINRAMGASTSQELDAINYQGVNKQKDLSNFLDGSRVQGR